MWISIFVVIAVVIGYLAWAVTSAYRGKSYPLAFRVKRGPTEEYELAGLTDVTNFLEARGLLAGSPEWDAALSGKPFEIDGTMMQFIPVEMTRRR